MKVKVFKGHHTDSRMGNHSYTCWTVTNDYVFVADGEEFYLQTSNYDQLLVYEIPTVDYKEFTEVEFGRLSESIKSEFYKISGIQNPDTLPERLEKSVRDREYFRSNLEEINKMIEKESAIKHFHIGNTPDGRVKQINTPWGIYLITCGTTAREGWFAYIQKSEKDIFMEKEASKKEFAQMCGNVARKLQIPFEVALAFKGNEAQIKNYVNGIENAINKQFAKDSSLMHELSCGRERASQAIQFMGIPIYRVDPNRVKYHVYESLESSGR